MKPVQRIVLFILMLIAISVSIVTLTRLFYNNSHRRYNNAVHLYNQWKNREAEKEIAPILKNSPGNLKAEFLYGNILFRLGKLNEAKRVYAAIATRNSSLKISALLKLAHTFFFLNDLDSAKIVLDETNALAKAVGNSSAIARSCYLEGLIAFNSLKYKKAMKLQKKSLDLAITLNDDQLKADALRQIGVLYWYSSRHDSALNYYYKPALKIYRKINDKIGEATTLSNIGLIYKDQEHLKKSIDYQIRAFILQKQIDDQIGLANSYYFLSSIISIAGWHSSIAYTFLQRSYKISKKIEYKWGMEVAGRALRSYFFANPDLSFQKLISSDSLSSYVGEGIIYTLWDKILTQKKQRDFEDENKNLIRYIRLCDSLDYRNGEQVALGYLAWSLANTGRYSEAESALKKAKKITSKIHLTTDFLLDTTQVQLDIKRGEIKKAAGTLIHLAGHFDSLYLNSISSVNKSFIENNISSIHQKRTAAYSMLIDILYSQHDQRLYEYVQKERAIPFWWRTNALYNDIDEGDHHTMEKFIEPLVKSDSTPPSSDYIQSLINYFSARENESSKVHAAISAFVSNKKKQLVIPTQTIRRNLGKNEVLVEYYVSKKHILIFVTRKESSAIIKSDVSESQLHSLATLYNGTIERGANNAADTLWRGISNNLYRLLIAPIVERGLLRENDHLIISPHKILHLLSFQTLNVSARGQPVSFCVEHYQISYVPSASFFMQMKKRKAPTYHSLITIAPDTKSLPGIEEEIHDIPQNHFNHYASLKDGDAKKNSVLGAFGNFDIVHIASHAEMNQWFPLYSSIECSDYNLKLYEILQGRIKAKLVILSACDTGVSISSTGGDPDNDDILSFSRAFLAKGSDAVVATFWVVNDRSTAQLMKLFYRNMFPENSISHDSHKKIHYHIAKALNAAQRQWITARRKAGKSIHPFYWGAFFVAGGAL